MKKLYCSRIIRLIALLWALPAALFAQGENNNWHFGKKMNINFNVSPAQLQQSNIETFEGCSAMSDAAGNLLFYTMGARIWDRNGNEMPNATGLLGNGPIMQGVPAGSSAQGVVIVPNPANAQQYYLFCGDAIEDATYKLYYSLIDMTLNGGMGDVVPGVKNVLLMNNVYECLSVTRGGDCKSYWVLARTSDMLTRDFYAFKVDQSGVSATPVITTPPPMALGGMPLTCFAADGVTMVSSGVKLILSKFNNLTGEVYDFVGIDSVPQGAVAFSPDASKVYVSANIYGVKQVDLSLMPNTAAVAASVISVDTLTIPNTFTVYGDVRLGPDGRIYVTKIVPNMGMDVRICAITNPNAAGTACHFTTSPFTMPAPWMPPSANSAYYTLGAPVVVNPPSDSVYHPVKDTLLCGGNTLELQSSNDDALHYTWSTGDTTATINASQDGLYWVRATNTCSITTDTFYVQFSDIHIDLGNDTTICAGNHVLLHAYDPGISIYRWNNGSTADTMDVWQTGTYFVTGSFKDCKVSDTITVNVVDPYFRILENDTTICDDRPLVLHTAANPESTYTWSNGATDASIQVSKAGTYAVTAQNQCGTYHDSVTIAVENCDCRLFLPNIFSPNGDGKNDKYTIQLACNATSYAMYIYNRYGQRIFQSTSQNTGWDGTFNGQPLDAGTYFYYIKFKDPLGKLIERKGDIILVR